MQAALLAAKKAFTKKVIIAGWRKTGLMPFDEALIRKNALANNGTPAGDLSSDQGDSLDDVLENAIQKLLEGIRKAQKTVDDQFTEVASIRSQTSGILWRRSVQRMMRKRKRKLRKLEPEKKKRRRGKKKVLKGKLL